jgi:hypothetical protein
MQAAISPTPRLTPTCDLHEALLLDQAGAWCDYRRGLGLVPLSAGQVARVTERGVLILAGIDPAIVLGDKPAPPPQPESRQLPPLYPPP